MSDYKPIVNIKTQKLKILSEMFLAQWILQ